MAELFIVVMMRFVEVIVRKEEKKGSEFSCGLSFCHCLNKPAHHHHVAVQLPHRLCHSPFSCKAPYVFS